MRADVLLQQGRHEMAIEEYRQALSFDPTNAYVHCRLAFALLQAGRWNEALRSSDVALTSEPNEPRVHWTRALIWLERSSPKEAEASIRRAIELDPTEPDFHGLLARCLLERSLREEAIAAADVGLALDADNELCLTFRARALAALGRHAESEGISETLLRDDPLDAWNHCLRADELLIQGRPNEAKTHYLEALRLDPGNAVARAGFATSLKARSPIFGLMLAFFIWTDRFKAIAVWGAILVLAVGVQVGGRLVADHAEWGVAYEIFRTVFFGAFILIFLAHPMFDLILRFDREGRFALSDDEKRATNWYLVCFGLAALCGVWAVWSGKSFLPKQIGIATLFLCAPIQQTFSATVGHVRNRMAALTITVATVLLTLPIMVPIAAWLVFELRSKLGMRLVLNYYLWTPTAILLFCAFSDSIRNWLEKRRPD